VFTVTGACGRFSAGCSDNIKGPQKRYVNEGRKIEVNTECLQMRTLKGKKKIWKERKTGR
jgi:hypothetical protein